MSSDVRPLDSCNAALIAAIEENDVARMAVAVEDGASVSTGLDECGRNALHFAAAYGHIDSMEWLVQHGADVDASHADGSTALHVAGTD
jgi:ankyrin repeat protein